MRSYHPVLTPLDNRRLTLYDTVTTGADRTPRVPVDKLGIPEGFIRILKKGRVTVY